MIKIKRAYEKASKSDGKRILVDRLWPRGIKKTELHMDEWLRDLSPSPELRKKFAHDPEKWSEFKSAYLKELQTEPAKSEVKRLLELAKTEDVTLLFAARDEEHNNAVVLKQQLERKLKRSS